MFPSGLGLDLHLHSTTAVFSPTIGDIQVIGREGHQKEGLRLLVYQDGALIYHRLQGKILRNCAILPTGPSLLLAQGWSKSNSHVLENENIVMKNSSQAGAPIDGCLQEVRRERGHEEGAVTDNVHQEGAVSNSCLQQDQ